MKVIMLGPPGAGKGTQATILSKTTGLPTLSTGHLLRMAVREKTPVGLEAQAFMEAGKLVPDRIIVEIVKESLERAEFSDGYILDGMPRTLAQAQMLDESGVVFDAVVLMELPDDIIVSRMTNRQICASCSEAYNLVSAKPSVTGICDKCGGGLVTRDDDKPDTVRHRLAVYHEETEPLIGYYEPRGMLRRIDARANISDTTRALLLALELQH